MNYNNLMTAYLAEGKKIIGKTVVEGNMEKKVQNIIGDKLNLKVILDDKSVIKYSDLLHYSIKK